MTGQGMPRVGLVHFVTGLVSRLVPPESGAVVRRVRARPGPCASPPDALVSLHGMFRRLGAAISLHVSAKRGCAEAGFLRPLSPGDMRAGENGVIRQRENPSGRSAVMWLRLAACRAGSSGLILRDDVMRYHPDVLLEQDPWLLMPRKN